MMRLKSQNDWTTAKDLRWHYKSKQLCEKANAPNCVHDSIMNFYLGNRKSLQGLRRAETLTVLIYAFIGQESGFRGCSGGCPGSFYSSIGPRR